MIISLLFQSFTFRIKANDCVSTDLVYVFHAYDGCNSKTIKKLLSRISCIINAS